MAQATETVGIFQQSHPLRPPYWNSGLIQRTNLCRGLPKHFIRKLESRLRRTETLLRSVLSYVSDEQLESSLRGVTPLVTPESSQDKENADPDVWQLYPLTTLEDVRAWQSRTAVPELPGPPSAHDPEEDAPVEDDSLPSQCGGMSGQSNQSPCPVREVTAAPDTRERTSQVEHHPTNAHPTSDEVGRRDSHAPHDSRARTDETSPVTSTFLPADFQKEFLW